MRYRQGREVVRTVAENLSRGGLFIRSAVGLVGLAVGDRVALAVELPGLGEFEVRTSVAHAIDPDAAQQHARAAGIGLRIDGAPEGFDDALAGYLARVGRRGERMVLVQNELFALLIAAAGYQVRPAPALDQLAAAATELAVPIIGIVAPSERWGELAEAADRAGLGDIAIGMDSADEVDRVLVRLDRGL